MPPAHTLPEGPRKFAPRPPGARNSFVDRQGVVSIFLDASGMVAQRLKSTFMVTSYVPHPQSPSCCETKRLLHQLFQRLRPRAASPPRKSCLTQDRGPRFSADACWTFGGRPTHGKINVFGRARSLVRHTRPLPFGRRISFHNVLRPSVCARPFRRPEKIECAAMVFAASRISWPGETGSDNLPAA